MMVKNPDRSHDEILSLSGCKSFLPRGSGVTRGPAKSVEVLCAYIAEWSPALRQAFNIYTQRITTLIHKLRGAVFKVARVFDACREFYLKCDLVPYIGTVKLQNDYMWRGMFKKLLAHLLI